MIDTILDKLKDHNLQSGGLALLALIVAIIAVKSAKLFVRLALFLVALACIGGAVWRHYYH